MYVISHRFAEPKTHHPRWFAFYVFGRQGIEVWFGHRYICVGRD